MNPRWTQNLYDIAFISLHETRHFHALAFSSHHDKQDFKDLSPINPREMRYFGDLASTNPVETRHVSEIASKNAHRRWQFTYLAVGHHFAARSSDNMHSLMHTKRSVLVALRSPIPIERDSFMILHSDISVKCDTSAILHRRIVEKTRIREISSLSMVAKCDSLVTCIGQSL